MKNDKKFFDKRTASLKRNLPKRVLSDKGCDEHVSRIRIENCIQGY